jgi:DNA mismatch repair protein MutL
MAAIRILSEQLVNQIAAGEVIERPASVVKELLENAVDAQASRILLELEEAGKKLIRVSDNGSGIAAADVPLALASHATSKLASASDLEAITTLGFRGEALASIASVADVRLVSRTADSLEAAEVTVSGGEAAAARPTSGPVGTSLEVRNLFRYVPARRKFLKTDATEMGHITEAVTRIALAYPAVHLTVTHNGRAVYELPSSDSVRGRVAAFFGSELADALIDIATDEPAGRLWGLVGPPHIARATNTMQYLFINGRYVRDRSLLHALREAYRGMLEGSRQPVAILFLAVPPDRVDVNVHPSKIEVRLREGHLLYGQVLASVREKLLGPGLARPLTTTAATERGGEAPGGTGEAFSASGGDMSDRDQRVRQAVADFLRSPAATTQERLPLAGRIEPSRPTTSPGAGYPHPAPAQGGRIQDYGSVPPAGSPLSGPAQANAAPEDYREPGATYPHPAPAATSAELPRGPYHAIQIHNTYLVAETDEGLLIVDQHAQHERILFEEIMRRLEAGPLESQRLLMPITLAVTDREMAALEKEREALARLGIEVEPLGPRDVGIHAFPLLLDRADPVSTLRDFLAWVLATDAAPTARQVLENLAHVAACRAAVKAGDALKAQEIDALLAHQGEAGLAPTCPHGRPTALVLRKADLEKQFGRDYAAPGAAAADEPLPF